MNDTIVKNWNETVPSDAQVYVLGDIMLNDNDEGIRLLKSLKGNIHIILGNHDTEARIELYKNCYNVVEVVDAKRLKYDGYHFFLSHYPCLCTNNDDDRPLNRRVICACGHSHYKNPFKDMDKGLIYHCELDCHESMPVEINKIIEELEWFSTLSMEQKNKISSMEVYK